MEGERTKGLGLESISGGKKEHTKDRKKMTERLRKNKLEKENRKRRKEKEKKRERRMEMKKSELKRGSPEKNK
jgi:hypothetical protein